MKLANIVTMGALLMILLLPQEMLAQSISLDHVDGLAGPDAVQTGVPITFHIRMTNNTASGQRGITNGLRVYSPSDADWTTTTADSTGVIGGAHFDLLWAIHYYSITGSDADTIGFAGAVMFNPFGMAEGFDAITHTITIGPVSPAEQGGEICLDSAYYPPTGTWQWVNVQTVHPAWDGPHCFLIDPCVLPPVVAGLVTSPAAPASGMSYDVSWSTTTQTNFYQLDERVNGGSWSQIYSGTTPSHGPVSHTPGTYEYRVRACNNDCGCGEYGQTVSIVILPDGPCEAPYFTFIETEDNYPISINSMGDNCPLLPCDEIGVFDGELCVGATVFDGDWPIDIFAWADDQLTPDVKDGYLAGNTMEFKVWRASIGIVEADFEPVYLDGHPGTFDYMFNAEVAVLNCDPCEPPDQVTGLLAVPAGPCPDEEYTLSWDAVAGTDAYELQERVVGGVWAHLNTGPGTSFGPLVAGEQDTKEYHVRACNDLCGCGDFSTTLAVEVAAPCDIIVNDLAVQWGELTMLVARLLCDDMPIAGVVLEFTIHNGTHPAVTGQDGYATVAYQAPATPGMYPIAVTYPDAPCGPVENMGGLNVEKHETNLIGFHADNANPTAPEIVTFCVELQDLDNGGAAIVDRLVHLQQQAGPDWVTIGSEMTDGQGQVCFEWPSGGDGSQNWRTWFEGDGLYFGAYSDAITINVNGGSCGDPYFTFIKTEDNYPISINSMGDNCPLLPCDEVGVFDGELCVGATVYDGTLPLDILAWEDDQLTPGVIDGYIFEHTMTFKVWRAGTGMLEDDFVPVYLDGHPGTFGYMFNAEVEVLECGCVPPNQVTELLATPASPVAEQDYVVSWDATDGAEGYELQDSVAVGEWSALGSVVDPTYGPLSNPSGTYYYRVRACNDCDCGPYSSALEVVVGEAPENCFEHDSLTVDSYSIIVTGITMLSDPLEPGDQVGVFDGDLCVGSQTFSSFPMPLSAWQDDPGDPVNGYTTGNPMSFKIARKENCEFVDVCADLSDYAQGDGLFGTAGTAWLDLYQEKCCSPLEIQLKAGWNFVSSNRDPSTSYLPELLASLGDQIDVIKALNSDFWVPMIDPCNPNDGWLCEWDVLQAYKVYMKSDQTLVISGDCMDCATPIDMNAGWNWVSYLPDEILCPDVAMETIIGCIDVVKGGGSLFWVPIISCPAPDWLCELEEGHGYAVYMNCPDVLQYNCTSPGCAQVSSSGDKISISSSYFGAYVQNTGDYHPVVVAPSEELNPGDEIGIFTTENILIGVGLYQGRNLPIAAWIDNPRTDVVDGYREGDRMVVKVWRSDDQEESPVGYVTTYGSDVLGDSPYSVIQIHSAKHSETLPTIMSLANYPNPFNPSTSIAFSLSEASHVQIDIYNLLGRRVAIVADADFVAGSHTAVWQGIDLNGESVSSGIYFYRVTTEHQTEMRKMLLVK